MFDILTLTRRRSLDPENIDLYLTGNRFPIEVSLNTYLLTLDATTDRMSDVPILSFASESLLYSWGSLPQQRTTLSMDHFGGSARRSGSWQTVLAESAVTLASEYRDVASLSTSGLGLGNGARKVGSCFPIFGI